MLGYGKLLDNRATQSFSALVQRPRRWETLSKRICGLKCPLFRTCPGLDVPNNFCHFRSDFNNGAFSFCREFLREI